MEYTLSEEDRLREDLRFEKSWSRHLQRDLVSAYSTIITATILLTGYLAVLAVHYYD